ncbi:hypothetical protein HA402_004661 [Bradysia odoriphaga]|nr:hypothetical protein HA402_004661 [Bradysia odoriphaga]
MAQKRSADEIFEGDIFESTKQRKTVEHVKKHTLDSEEEDSGDDETYNIMNDNDIEGEEDGVSGMDGEVKVTPFNMREELEEGHFDADGHFQWNKDNEIKDNWLDNLDWVKIKARKDGENANIQQDDSTDSDDEQTEFDLIGAYRRILELMQPKETIKRSLQRLGGKSAKMSSAERWKMKKAGIVDPNAALVTELTELTNTILTRMGNMDVYEETYEQIHAKYAAKTQLDATKPANGASSSANDELDMYADNFDTKEKMKLDAGSSNKTNDAESVEASTEVMWEFKWKQADTQVHGPYSSSQMQQWVTEGYFKDGVFVKKFGQDSQFNSSNRIDFELYL